MAIEGEIHRGDAVLVDVGGVDLAQDCRLAASAAVCDLLAGAGRHGEVENFHVEVRVTADHRREKAS